MYEFPDVSSSSKNLCEHCECFRVCYRCPRRIGDCLVQVKLHITAHREVCDVRRLPHVRIFVVLAYLSCCHSIVVDQPDKGPRTLVGSLSGLRSFVTVCQIGLLEIECVARSIWSSF